MSDYSQTTFFTQKDNLPTGSASKLIKAAEHDDEFDNISQAIATKADAVDHGLALSTKTVSLDINALTPETPAGFDNIMFNDIVDTGGRTEELYELADVIATGGITGVDNATGILEVDPSAATLVTIAADDELLFADVSDSDSLKKAPISAIPGAIATGGDTALVDSSGVVAIDITEPTALASDDIVGYNDFVLVHDTSVFAHGKMYPYAMVQETCDQATAVEVDDLDADDTRVALVDGELRQMQDQHIGRRVRNIPGNLFSILESDGNGIVYNSSGAPTLIALPSVVGMPRGWNVWIVSAEAAANLVIVAATGEYISNYIRSGFGAAGYTGVTGGGIVKVVLTANGTDKRWCLTGDIN